MVRTGSRNWSANIWNGQEFASWGTSQSWTVTIRAPRLECNKYHLTQGCPAMPAAVSPWQSSIFYKSWKRERKRLLRINPEEKFILNCNNPQARRERMRCWVFKGRLSNIGSDVAGDHVRVISSSLLYDGVSWGPGDPRAVPALNTLVLRLSAGHERQTSSSPLWETWRGKLF